MVYILKMTSVFSILFVLSVLCMLYVSAQDTTSHSPQKFSKKWFQLCEVKMPDHIEGSEWVWNTFPAYCAIERVKLTSTYQDTKCVSDSEDGVNYCDLTKLAYKLPKRFNDLGYRCNVYNATTGQFFYYGNVWTDYADC